MSCLGGAGGTNAFSAEATTLAVTAAALLVAVACPLFLEDADAPVATAVALLVLEPREEEEEPRLRFPGATGAGASSPSSNTAAESETKQKHSKKQNTLKYFTNLPDANGQQTYICYLSQCAEQHRAPSHALNKMCSQQNYFFSPNKKKKQILSILFFRTCDSF
jgi:hypothetical protein